MSTRRMPVLATPTAGAAQDTGVSHAGGTSPSPSRSAGAEEAGRVAGGTGGRQPSAERAGISLLQLVQALAAQPDDLLRLARGGRAVEPDVGGAPQPAERRRGEGPQGRE